MDYYITSQRFGVGIEQLLWYSCIFFLNPLYLQVYRRVRLVNHKSVRPTLKKARAPAVDPHNVVWCNHNVLRRRCWRDNLVYLPLVELDGSRARSRFWRGGSTRNSICAHNIMPMYIRYAVRALSADHALYGIVGWSVRWWICVELGPKGVRRIWASFG